MLYVFYGRLLVFGCVFVTSIYAVSCPKGTFISRSSVSGCQVCPNGTFSDAVNSTKCRKCDECRGIHNHVTTTCTATSNTKCTCEAGYYYDGFLMICLKCHACKKGKGVIQNCTSVSNTVCGFCEKDKTFSDTKDFNPCRKCTKCPKGDWVEQECTRRSDTVCKTEKDKNGSKRTRPVVGRERSGISAKTTKATTTDKRSTNTWSTTHNSSPTHNSTDTRPDQESSLPSKAKPQIDPASESSDNAYIIALSVLSGFAVVVLLITLALMYHCKKRARNLAKPRDKEKAEEPTSSTSISKVVGAQENPYSSLPLIGTRQEKMLRDAPYTLISNLANYLNPGNRWKDLGGRLNFNNTQISNFALVQQNATQAMLEEWGQRDCATVVALRNILHSMKWAKEERICAEYV